MSNAYLMIGMPGAGKSTWIKTYFKEGIEVVSRDIIRAELGYSHGVDDKVVLDKAGEELVTKEEYRKIKELCEQGKDFAIDDTNLSRYRKDMIDYLKKNNALVTAVLVETPLEVCIERRKNQIDKTTMIKIFNKIIPLQENEVDNVIRVKAYNESKFESVINSEGFKTLMCVFVLAAMIAFFYSAIVSMNPYSSMMMFFGCTGWLLVFLFIANGYSFDVDDNSNACKWFKSFERWIESKLFS